MGDEKEKDLAATARLLEVIRQEASQEEPSEKGILEEKETSPFLKRKRPFPLSQVKIGLEVAETYCHLVSLETGIGQSRLLGFRLVKFKKGDYLTGIKTAMDNISGQFKLIVGINHPSVIIKQLTMPKLSRKEMKEAIFWEARRYLPYGIEEMVFDFQILAQVEDKTEVLIVAVPREVMDRIINAFYSAKLKFHITDVAPLALMNAYLANYSITLNETIVLLHLGETLGILDVYTEGGVLFNRYLSLPAKEELKIFKSWEPVLFEIRRALTYYEDQYKPKGFKKIILSGSCAYPEFKNYIEQELGLPVEIFDPWRNIQVDKTAFGEKLLEKNGPRLSVATGLALR